MVTINPEIAAWNDRNRAFWADRSKNVEQHLENAAFAALASHLSDSAGLVTFAKRPPYEGYIEEAAAFGDEFVNAAKSSDSDTAEL